MKTKFLIILALLFITYKCGQISTTEKQVAKTIYEIELEDKQGNIISLSQYKGKVLLIVNTATQCGFTYQYAQLELMYRQLKDYGFEIIDLPCNQFGSQAPGTDNEILEFCQANYGITFMQFKKSDVNGQNEIPLYKWLKEQKGFDGFDPESSLTPLLESLSEKADPEWRSKSDIKWNFTKFVIDRTGNVVARFEPTKDMAQVEEFIRKELNINK